MPIEIRELEVVMSVSAPQASTMSGSSSPEQHSVGGGGDVDQIVAQCVEQVLFILSNQNER
jgi:hypothetical protein